MNSAKKKPNPNHHFHGCQGAAPSAQIFSSWGQACHIPPRRPRSTGQGPGALLAQHPPHGAWWPSWLSPPQPVSTPARSPGTLGPGAPREVAVEQRRVTEQTPPPTPWEEAKAPEKGRRGWEATKSSGRRDSAPP